jgi:type II secretory pathway pseudopilin PulG
LVVIAIIMVLAALLMPSLQNATKQAAAAHCSSNLHNIYLAVHSWMRDHDQIEPFYNYNGYSDWGWMERSRMADYLVEQGDYLDNAAVFFCISSGLNYTENYSATPAPQFWLIPTTYLWVYHGSRTAADDGGLSQTNPIEGYKNMVLFDGGNGLFTGWYSRWKRIGTLRNEHYNALYLHGNVELNFADSWEDVLRITQIKEW